MSKNILSEVSERIIVEARLDGENLKVKVGAIAGFNGRTASEFVDVAVEDADDLKELLEAFAEKYQSTVLEKAVKALFVSGN